MTTVAVLGTGRMGGAIARRLGASGLDVAVWDRTTATAEALNIGRVARTPADATRGAEFAISIVTDAAGVAEVYLGPHGAFAGGEGTLFIEMSTAGPDSIERLSTEASAQGRRLLEAPVIGSVPAIESGTLAILVGGSPQDLAQARPVLGLLGEIHHVGAIGSAARLKLVSNSMLGIISAGAAELLAAGAAAGLEREQVFWALARQAPGLNARKAGFLQDRQEPVLFAVRDLVKDLGLALEVYERVNAAVPLTSQAGGLFAEAATDSSGLDISAIVRLYSGGGRPRDDAGSKTRA